MLAKQGVAGQRQQDCEGWQHPLWPMLSFSAQIGRSSIVCEGWSGESAVSAIRSLEYDLLPRFHTQQSRTVLIVNGAGCGKSLTDVGLEHEVNCREWSKG